jgi:hypothetical protein
MIRGCQILERSGLEIHDLRRMDKPRADRIEGFFSGSPFGLDADGDYDAGTDTDNDGD